MLKSYEFRIYPTKEQEQLFIKANGLCRLYWNTALVRKQEVYENNENWNIGSAKAVFTECKPEALEWIKEIDSTILAADRKSPNHYKPFSSYKLGRCSVF